MLPYSADIRVITSLFRWLDNALRPFKWKFRLTLFYTSLEYAIREFSSKYSKALSSAISAWIIWTIDRLINGIWIKQWWIEHRIYCLWILPLISQIKSTSSLFSLRSGAPRCICTTRRLKKTDSGEFRYQLLKLFLKQS